MKKIRINELARELEVKPGAILDLLPEFGVSEKKTHSSSVDDDVAEQIRQHFSGEAGAARRQMHRQDEEDLVTDEKVMPVEPVVVEAAEGAPRTQQPETRAEAHEVEEPKPHEAEVPHEKAAEPAAAPARKASPIRPPLATPGAPRVIPPSIPIPRVVTTAHPPVVRPPAGPPAAPPPPAPVSSAPAAPAVRPGTARPAPGAQRPAPSAPSAPPATMSTPAAPAVSAPPPPPQAPPAMQIAPGAPAVRPGTPPPAPRTAPVAPGRAGAPGAPRPGQIISGPRTAPEGLRGALPGAPKPTVPQMPRPPLAQQPASASSSGQSVPQATRPLVGQPAARPVVPPRPDLVARLAQAQPKAAPGQPAARPGMPMPGQPLYQGPRRGPGQPGVGRGMPGAPGGAPGGRPIRGRGQHPTAPILEPPTPATEAGRRDAAKKRAAQRTKEIEEGKLRGPVRRAEVELPVIDKEIAISEGITVKELSEKLGVRAALVIKVLLERKVLATINQTLDVKLAEELAKSFGATTSRMSYEEESVQEIVSTEVAGDLEMRPPVVTIMGHVDHGKTSLLDAIRLANVAEKEAGGITQHIGAYHVDLNGRKIVFIDTPGHEAFTRMRARGAKVTDIVVLVVAADDGVMPQTREAIDHSRAAKVPIIVALNKIDKPEAQPERVKQQLTDLGLMPEDWGGDTPFVPVSAKQRQNLDLLLEMILLVADMQELKANPARPAVATVLEAQVDRGRGPVATLLVRNGTLRVGDHYLCGTGFGRVRALFDDRGNPVRDVGPSMPAELIGLDALPDVGDTLQVVTDVAKARQIAEFREVKAREAAMAKTRVSLEAFHAKLREGETKELNIILKADVGGSAEVIAETLQKLSNDKVQIRVLHAGVGAIREYDVALASASDAIIIGFNVRPERKAAEAAEQEKVDIRLHTIIYELTDEIKKAMTGLLEPVYKEVYKGRAEVRETFRISKVGTIAGSYVQDGSISRDCEVRLLRDNVVVYTGRIDSLKRFKNDASEVKAGFECGIGLANFNDVKPADIIEAFVKEKVSQETFA